MTKWVDSQVWMTPSSRSLEFFSKKNHLSDMLNSPVSPRQLAAPTGHGSCNNPGLEVFADVRFHIETENF